MYILQSLTECHIGYIQTSYTNRSKSFRLYDNSTTDYWYLLRFVLKNIKTYVSYSYVFVF